MRFLFLSPYCEMDVGICICIYISILCYFSIYLTFSFSPFYVIFYPTFCLSIIFFPSFCLSSIFYLSLCLPVSFYPSFLSGFFYPSYSLTIIIYSFSLFTCNLSTLVYVLSSIQPSVYQSFSTQASVNMSPPRPWLAAAAHGLAGGGPPCGEALRRDRCWILTR